MEKSLFPLLFLALLGFAVFPRQAPAQQEIASHQMNMSEDEKRTLFLRVREGNPQNQPPLQNLPPRQTPQTKNRKIRRKSRQSLLHLQHKIRHNLIRRRCFRTKILFSKIIIFFFVVSKINYRISNFSKDS